MGRITIGNNHFWEGSLLKYLIISLTVFSIFFGSGRTINAEPTAVLIGFIENNQHKALRVAFQKNKKMWLSICPPNKEIESVNDCRIKEGNRKIAWNIVFKGKRIGEVITKKYLRANYYSDVGLTELSSNRPLPFAEKTDEFSGWIGEPVNRPLVSTTTSHFTDPEDWNPAALDSIDLKLLWPFFKKLAGDASNCITDAQGNETAVKWSYQQKDIVIVKAYLSNRRGRLIGVRINPDLNKCDGPREREWSTFWFFVSPDRKITPLSLTLRHADSEYDLVPIDFGDYDGDGKSEVLFWVSSYNEDGYVMFYDDFSKNVVFTWFYH